MEEEQDHGITKVARSSATSKPSHSNTPCAQNCSTLISIKDGVNLSTELGRGLQSIALTLSTEDCILEPTILLSLMETKVVMIISRSLEMGQFAHELQIGDIKNSKLQ